MELFTSTRGEAQPVRAPEAVLRGIAPDGGLYIRKEMPELPVEELIGADYPSLAGRVLSAFLLGYSEQEIASCVEHAYDSRFDTSAVAPLVQVGDMHLLELFHGPTAAFKDVALSILPRLMRCAAEKTGFEDEILILTATSGDTGSAALEGFKNVPGIRVVVFYPENGISPIQRAQMTTMQGDNLAVCAVKGNFDDAQTGVKRVFAAMPKEFCRENKLSLSSANSINIGRLAPQIAYYYSAYLDMLQRAVIQAGERVNFCVPTGNFGDILAGYYAKKMGLPIGKLICASNANDVLTDFLQRGIYDKRRAFHVTTSPSMDILVSSNLERLLYDALDGDANAVRERMRQLQDSGHYALPEAAMERIREDFVGLSVSDAQASQTICEVFRAHRYLLDPHTAVAWHAAELYRKQSGDAAPCVVLSTASPYKFPQTVLQALGEPQSPDAGAQLEDMERLTGTDMPAPFRNILEKQPRFTDVILPEDMLDYVMRKAAEK